MSFPPPPLRQGPTSTSASNRNVTRPLTLTTNLPSGHGATQLNTPLSTSSVLTPVLQMRTAGYTPSAGPGSRGVSPMASRTPVYNVPYNPGEWISGNQRAPQAENRVRSGAEAEDGIDAPPPPYTPASRVTSTALVMSPEGAAFSYNNSSQANTPTSARGVSSPFLHGSGRSRDEPNASTGNNRNSSHQHYTPPPPPPPPGHPPSNVATRQSASQSRCRPNSIASLSVIVHSPQILSEPDYDLEMHQSHPGRPPAAKRAVSAGAVSTSNSSCTSRENSVPRSSSSQSSWQPGLVLPGPPPGPPPTSSRSQSASGTLDVHRKHSSQPTGRPQSYRIPLKAPVLGPVPPTPAGWVDDQPLRSTNKPSTPLQIQTTNLEHREVNEPRNVAAEPTIDQNEESGVSSGGLARSAALRDSSVKGLRERRKLRRSTYENELSELGALNVNNNNPWADALNASTSSGKLSTTSTNQTPTRIEALREVSNITPKALPTPPLSQKAPYSAHSILSSSSSSIVELNQADADEEMRASLHRHREFLLKETRASTEVEKLQHYVDYILAESRLKRQQYANAFVNGQFDTRFIAKNLFEDVANQSRPTSLTYPSHDVQSQRKSVDAATDSRMPHESRLRDYQPDLSPIASMSNDELSSRGRAPSRWWESQTGSNSDGITQKLKRSKRESKYMGLSAALMQSGLPETNTPNNAEHDIKTSDESYPDEKVNLDSFGFYEDEQADTTRSKSKHKATSSSLRDISRLITLPPPYPRHYPAVNNSHPDLTTFRNTVRNLSDLSEVQTRRDRHKISVEALRSDHKQKQTKIRQTFKENVQSQLEEGTLTYAEAAEAENALRLEEQEADRKTLQAEYDILHDVVIKPLHEMLNDRLVRMDDAINELRDRIIIEAQSQTPDRAQREGDDTPEMLEYLTQVKWLFETREQIHKEIFDLFTERNNQYRSIVLLPYQQAKNAEKVRNTEAFFFRDSLDRQTTFYTESLARYQGLFKIIEENIDRAVESQSSAFWDIAPGIADLVQELPTDFYRLGKIAISEEEYLENPSYYRFPQQYLYSLLDHAEKSTYQFIESQTNLHCLLHEVKSSLLTAEYKAQEARNGHQKENTDNITFDLDQLKSEREALLTAQLKQKVSLIEEQWLEALGSQIQARKEQIKAMLQEHGGWEEMEQDNE